MKVAVTYEDGKVFQHFGHTEYFKIYDVKDGKVVGSEIIPTDGSGHGALAGFLAAHKADALICEVYKVCKRHINCCFIYNY